MNKLILLTLLSFPTLAIDLSEDNVYYCISSLGAQIHSSKSATLKPERFTLKLKESVVSIKMPESALVEWDETNFADKVLTDPDYLFASGLTGTIWVELKPDSKELAFNYFKSFGAHSKATMQILQGTCTKF